MTKSDSNSTPYSFALTQWVWLVLGICCMAFVGCSRLNNDTHPGGQGFYQNPVNGDLSRIPLSEPFELVTPNYPDGPWYLRPESVTVVRNPDEIPFLGLQADEVFVRDSLAFFRLGSEFTSNPYIAVLNLNDATVSLYNNENELNTLHTGPIVFKELDSVYYHFSETGLLPWR